MSIPFYDVRGSALVGPATLQNGLQVNGTAALGSSLSVAGPCRLLGETTMNGSLAVQGNGTVEGHLSRATLPPGPYLARGPLWAGHSKALLG